MKHLNKEMPADTLVGLLKDLEVAGIEVWLDGGWAVDAALGKQTRSHKDVDIILRISDLGRLDSNLERKGFKRKPGGVSSNYVLEDGSGLEVDVHAVVFDEEGNGIYRMENGADWLLPASGFTGRGRIGDLSVRCLSPEVQVQCHAQGYVPSEKDFHDMELLQEYCGVTLPPSLQRSRRED